MVGHPSHVLVFVGGVHYGEKPFVVETVYDEVVDHAAVLVA